MSLTKELQHIRPIEYRSDQTSDSFHEAGVKTVQNFLYLERYIGSGVLEGGDTTKAGGRIWINLPVKGLVNGHRIVFDATKYYTVTNDSTGYLWLDVDDDLQETLKAPDATAGLILCGFKAFADGQIKETIDERILIPKILNQFTYLSWRGWVSDVAHLPLFGSNGDAYLAGSNLYIWMDQPASEMDSVTRSYWKNWKTTSGIFRAFKYFNVDGTAVITADSTADSITFVEGRNIRFEVQPDLDDATIAVKMRTNLDMNHYQIRRVKMHDATGTVKVKGDLRVYDDIKIDEAVFGEAYVETMRLILGKDSTTTTSLLQADGTYTATRLFLHKGNIDATSSDRAMIIHGNVDVTGNIRLSGTINGVDPDSHGTRHNFNEEDEVNLTGLSGILRDKQSAAELQGTPISTETPGENDILTFTGTEWKPEPDTTEMTFLETMATINGGFGRPSRFQHLRGHTEFDLQFDSTNVWDVISLTRAFGTVTTPAFGGGTYDGKYVYLTRQHNLCFIRFNPEQPFINEDDPREAASGGQFFQSFINLGDDYRMACFDGQYIYYAPQKDGDFLRFDTKFSSNRGRAYKNFWFTTDISDNPDSSAWEKVTSSSVIGRDSTGTGLAFDGRYVYYSSSSFSNWLHRYDTKGPFGDKTSWDEVNKVTLVGTAVAYDTPFFDGRYVWFFPDTGKTFLRFDTEVSTRLGFTFNDQTVWSTLNSETYFPGADSQVKGAATDGRYIYFAPSSRIGTDATIFSRLDLTQDWNTATSWEHISFFDLFAKVTGGSYGDGRVWFWGATFDGRYIYYAPYNSNSFVRFDTKGRFTNSSSWDSINMIKVMRGKADEDFSGCIYDGQYVTFVPEASGTLVRVKAFPCGGMFSRWGE